MPIAAQVQPPSDAITEPEARPVWRRALDRVFGYDFFISYAWSDGAAYAQALAGRLESEGFEVFLDRTAYASGDDWKKVGAWTLRRTGQLILVGSPAALRSPPVLREVDIFSRSGRRIVPIDFAGSLEWTESDCPLARYLPIEVLRIKEPAGALQSGPSDETVSTLRRTFKLVRQDKKRVRVFAVVAFLLLLLSMASTGFAVFAEQQRQRAERRFDLAINIAAGVVDKAVALSDAYRVPKSAIGELLDWANLSFGALSKEDLPDRLKAAQANVLMVFSDYYGKINNSEQQLAVAQQARDLLAPLVEAKPDDDAWRARLSMIYDRIAQANIARGNLADALAASREALKEDERRLASRPSDPAPQRAVSVSQERIGTVRRLQGKLDEAMSAQQAAHAITTRLAAERPDDVASQRDLAVSYEKIGELLEVSDKPDEALASHQAALRIRSGLVQRRPNDTALQRELAVSYNKVGEMLLAGHEFGQALAAHQASLEIAKRLSDSDPANADWQSDLAATHLRLGDVLYAEKRPAEALGAFKESLTIGERLVAADPRKAIFKCGVATSHERIGDVELDFGQVDAALASYRKKRDIAAELVADSPANGVYLRDLLIAHVKVGDALRAKGVGAEEPRESYAKALSIARNMRAAGLLDPQDAWMLTELEARVRK